MGTQSLAEYCRAIEAYLCQKNDGHLIRVVGPSFDIVSGWAVRGVPLKVAFEGVNRYFERYYRKGPRRRPVRIDFCEADVLDVFDEWRKAVGLVVEGVERRESGESGHEAAVTSRLSLPAHLERVVTRLTAARAAGVLGDDLDALIDGVARDLDAARAEPAGLRGEARRKLVERLAVLDGELVNRARDSVDPATLIALARAADTELAPFRALMTPDDFSRAQHAATDQLVREHLGLPTIAFR